MTPKRLSSIGGPLTHSSSPGSAGFPSGCCRLRLWPSGRCRSELLATNQEDEYNRTLFLAPNIQLITYNNPCWIPVEDNM